MKLLDLLSPGDTKPDNTTLSKLVRLKSFKTMVKALSMKNNPKDEDYNQGDFFGDGKKQADVSDNETTDFL